MPVIDKFFANSAAVPTMPEVATRLLRSFDSEDLGLQDIADLVAQDQGLAAKLVRLANSAQFGQRRAISSLKDAAAMIGLTSLRDMALAACVAGTFPQVAGFDRLRFWRHSLATAGHARQLALSCDDDADTAYLAGLVLRTGELLMLMVEPDAVVLAERRAVAPDSLLEHQLLALDCTHLEVTAELARRWGFPGSLVQAVETVADPLGAQPFSRLGAVLRLASVMADAGERQLPVITTLHELQPELLAHLEIDLAWVERYLMPYQTLTSSVDQLLG